MQKFYLRLTAYEMDTIRACLLNRHKRPPLRLKKSLVARIEALLAQAQAEPNLPAIVEGLALTSNRTN